MRTRFTWILALVALVAIGVVIACSTTYNSSYDGLVVVPTQGALVMQTFSLDLGNGHISQVTNPNGPPTNGVPGALVLDPAGAFAYLIVYANPGVPGSETGIQTFQVASDGKLAPIGTTPLNSANVQPQVPVDGQTTEMVPVVPVALTMDSKGEFLFVANGATSDTAGNPVPGSVTVLTVGSKASLNEVTGSPFVLPVGDVNLFPLPQNPCTATVQCSGASALAVTPTVYPPLYSYCSGHTPPTTENLYVTDKINYMLYNYSVDPSSGTLSLMFPPSTPTVPGVPTGTVPSGVAVDPCNRFVYVANASPNNNVSAYTICSTVSLPNCPNADFSLLPVNGAPYSLSPGDNPGPMAEDAYGNFLYVVDTESSAGGLISAFRISPTTGALTPLSPPTAATNSGPNSIAIRSDDSWMFVTNFNSATLSQYAIAPATGALTPVTPPTGTFTQPTGVAVK